MANPDRHTAKRWHSGPSGEQPSPLDRFMALCRAEAKDPRGPLMRVGLSGVILIGSTTPTKSPAPRGEDPRLGAPFDPPSPPDGQNHIRVQVDPHGKTPPQVVVTQPAANDEPTTDQSVAEEQVAVVAAPPAIAVPIPTPSPHGSPQSVETLNPEPSATQGPFRAGMSTGFHNAPTLTAPMAASMNLVYDRLRDFGFTRNASLAWSLHGIHESEGGTIFTQIGGGDGVGYFQLSGWRGGGAGSFTSQLTKPGTDRNWARSDFEVDTGATDTLADRERILINSADALVHLLAEDGDETYRRLYNRSRLERYSLSDIADRSTRDFIRPGAVSYSARARDIRETYQQNQAAIDANTDAFEALRADHRRTLLPNGNPFPVPVPRPADLGVSQGEAAPRQEPALVSP